MLKTGLLFLVIATACAFGNPAAGAKEWRWKARRHATVSPNVKGLPLKKVADTYTPSVRIPGTKTVEGCGPVKPHSRIVGGTEATPHSYPWQVRVILDEVAFCGGSVINEQWVLTAGHCLDGTKVVEVVAGAHNIQINETTQIRMISHDFFVHDLYDMDEMANDIGLIHLPEPLTWTDAIAPVCLPSRSAGQLAPGTLVTPTGWGFTSDSNDAVSSDVLLQVTVPVMDTAECSAIYGGSVQDTYICIDSVGGKGSCEGDSGGPLNYVEEGVTYTRGVVSFSSSTGCETGYPDGYTRVIDYLDWIETKTGIAIDD